MKASIVCPNTKCLKESDNVPVQPRAQGLYCYCPVCGMRMRLAEPPAPLRKLMSDAGVELVI